MMSVGKVAFFSRFVTIFWLYMALLVKKMLGSIFLLSKSVFGYFKTKKVLMTTKLEGA